MPEYLSRTSPPRQRASSQPEGQPADAMQGTDRHPSPGYVTVQPAAAGPSLGTASPVATRPGYVTAPPVATRPGYVTVPPVAVNPYATTPFIDPRHGLAQTPHVTTLSPAFSEPFQPLQIPNPRSAGEQNKIVIPMINGMSLQRAAPDDRRFTLDYRDGSYTVKHDDASASTPGDSGFFSFVILPERPDDVILGIPEFIQKELEGLYISAVTQDAVDKFGIEGHTSLSGGKGVLFAGEIVLLRGQMIRWGNGSGHYKPDEKLRHGNLSDRVKNLLPESKFVSHLSERGGGN